MAKKKSNSVDLVFSFLPLVLGAIAVVMLFLNCAKITAGLDLGDLGSFQEDVAKYTGLQMIFGYSVTNDVAIVGEVTTTYFSFNVLGVIALACLVAGAVFSLLSIKGKFGKLISALCFVIAAVLLFVFKSTVVSELKENLTILAPVYIAAACSLLAAVVAGLPLVRK